MIACLFPGQGSHQAGQGAEYRESAAWALVASLGDAMEVDLEFLLLEAGSVDLRRTENAQAVAFGRNWLEWQNFRDRTAIDERDDVVFVGHSVGEYSALAAAGALDPLDAARVVAVRGRAMAAACDAVDTGMIAISGEGCIATVESARSEHEDVTVANVNSPFQVVLAGPWAPLREVASVIGGMDKYLRIAELPVAGAFHTRFMRPARAEIAEVLRPLGTDHEFAPVVSNRDGDVHTSWSSLMDVMVNQVVEPVRWDLCGRRIGELGVEQLWESAPKPMLSGFVERANPGSSIVRIW